jgi:hypothetical protein
MESLAYNTDVVQYHTLRNENVFGTNNFDGITQKGKYGTVLVHWPHNSHTHFYSRYE